MKQENERRELQTYEPYIVKSINADDSLFCILTGSLFSRNLASAQKHVNGLKYKRALGTYVYDTIRYY